MKRVIKGWVRDSGEYDSLVERIEKLMVDDIFHQRLNANDYRVEVVVSTPRKVNRSKANLHKVKPARKVKA